MQNKVLKGLVYGICEIYIDDVLTELLRDVRQVFERLCATNIALNPKQTTLGLPALGKLVTEKPVDFVGFDNVVEFNKNRQNDDNVVKAYKDLFS